jgi:hypothetical protein
MIAVGKGDGTGLAQQADFAHLLARQPLGQGRHRMNPHTAVSRARRRTKSTSAGSSIIGSVSGDGDDCGDAARCGGEAGACQRFPVFRARLPDSDIHVDEARGQAMAPLQSMIVAP